MSRKEGIFPKSQRPLKAEELPGIGDYDVNGLGDGAQSGLFGRLASSRIVRGAGAVTGLGAVVAGVQIAQKASLDAPPSIVRDISEIFKPNEAYADGTTPPPNPNFIDEGPASTPHPVDPNEPQATPGPDNQPQLTPAPIAPHNEQFQLIVNKSLDANRNGIIDSADIPFDQAFRAGMIAIAMEG